MLQFLPTILGSSDMRNRLPQIHVSSLRLSDPAKLVSFPARSPNGGQVRFRSSERTFLVMTKLVPADMLIHAVR